MINENVINERAYTTMSIRGFGGYLQPMTTAAIKNIQDMLHCA